MQPSLRCPRVVPSIACVKHLRQVVQSTRPFSTTSRRDVRTSRARRLFFNWIATKGANFRSPLPGSTNYLNAYTKDGQLKRVLKAHEEKERQMLEKAAAEASGRKYNSPDSDSPAPKETPDAGKPTVLSRWKAERQARLAAAAKGVGSGNSPSSTEPVPVQDSANFTPAVEELPMELQSDLIPFPQNKAFISQPVLSEKFRQKIWEAIILEGKTVREVSAQYNVEMSRVGAVVRLIEVQKEWERIKKPLAVPYAKAVMNMLPKTLWLEDQPDVKIGKRPHESINDLPVHRATGQQIFHPTSESRIFTRKDAAKVFHEKLLPADDRVPHPELAILHKEYLDGVPAPEREQRQAARREAEEEKQNLAAELRAKKEAAVKRVDTGKWEFRFTNISVESAGKDGRGRHGTGWRYGTPHMDRKKGAVRIPTTVEG